jgi:U3 small nucleolar RNA-associated protein 19
MRLIKERSAHLDVPELRGSSTGFFRDVLTSLLETPEGEIVRDEFLDKFVKEYDDIRYSTFAHIAYVFLPWDSLRHC